MRRPERSRPLPEYLKELQAEAQSKHPDLHPNMISVAMEQSGMMPLLLRRNPELKSLLLQFFTGQIRILLVGGESGMGKSLFASDIRLLHGDLQLVGSEELHSNLSIVTWDRTHQAFFEEISTEIGGTIPLPEGETLPRARDLVSKVIGDQVRHLLDYYPPQTRILVESPLYDQRGESIFSRLGAYRNSMSTVIMHSPESRAKTLVEGRNLHTSAKKKAMEEMREKLIMRLVGPSGTRMSLEAQDQIIKEWWIKQLKDWNGLVVEWDPDEDTTHYNQTVQTYQDNWLRPDVLAPRALSRFTRGQLEAVLRAQPDLDAFIYQIAGLE